MNVLRSLKHRPFALLWSGQTISRLGNSLYRIALAWWVLEKTGSTTAMGTVLNALWLGQYKHLRRRGLLGYIPVMVNSFLLLLFGLQSPIPVLVIAIFFYGVCFNIFTLVWTNTLQEMVPNDKLGRVYAFDSLGSWVLLPIGFSFAGWATDRIGAPMVFIIGGCGTILMTLSGLSHPAVRNLD